MKTIEQVGEQERQAVEQELTFEEQVQRARFTLGREPAKREQYYTALLACEQAGEQGVGRFELTARLEALPQSKTVYTAMGSLVDTLTRVGALDEELPAPEFDEDTQEEFIDAAKARYHLGAVGAQLLDELRPSARLDALFAQRPEYAPAFRELLEFCVGQSRTLAQVNELLDDYCAAIPNRRHVTGKALYPNFFLNKVKDAGGLVWNDGWTTTREGEAFLAVLQ